MIEDFHRTLVLYVLFMIYWANYPTDGFIDVLDHSLRMFGVCLLITLARKGIKEKK